MLENIIYLYYKAFERLTRGGVAEGEGAWPEARGQQLIRLTWFAFTFITWLCRPAAFSVTHTPVT